MDRAQHSPGVLKEDPFSPNRRGRTILTLILIGAAFGCFSELLRLAWPGGAGGVGGWAFLYRSIRGAIGLPFGFMVCCWLARDWRRAIPLPLMGAVISQFGPISSAFAWSEFLGSAWSGVSCGFAAGFGGAIAVHLIWDRTAKAKVAPDPLDDGI